MKKYKKVYLEITNICNKNCSFCHGTKREKREMSEDNFDRALESLKGVTDYLYFHLLGEPLCHPKIETFIKKASDSGFKVSLTTNGTLISQHREALIKTPPYKISFSLHSFEEGDGQREYLEEIISLSKEIKKRGTIVSLRLWNKGAYDNSETERILRKNFEGAWKKGTGDSFSLEKGIYLEYATPFIWPDMALDEHKERAFCYGLRDQFGILADGTVVPCCLDAEGDIALGNIFTEPLLKILSSQRAVAIKRGFDNRNPVEDLCKKCRYALKF